MRDTHLGHHRSLLPSEPPKKVLLNNASHYLVTTVRHTPDMCDAVLQTTFFVVNYFAVKLRQQTYTRHNILLCGCFWISFVFLKVSILNTVVPRFILASQRGASKSPNRELYLAKVRSCSADPDTNGCVKGGHIRLSGSGPWPRSEEVRKKWSASTPRCKMHWSICSSLTGDQNDQKMLNMVNVSFSAVTIISSLARRSPQKPSPPHPFSLDW